MCLTLKFNFNYKRGRQSILTGLPRKRWHDKERKYVRHTYRRYGQAA